MLGLEVNEVRKLFLKPKTILPNKSFKRSVNSSAYTRQTYRVPNKKVYLISASI